MVKEYDSLAESPATKIEDTVHEPPRYRVLMHNDNYTTMEFVIQVLEEVFFKCRAEAVQIMLSIHRRGIGMCGTFTAELAETKIVTVHHLARQNGFPLKCSMEEI